MDIYENIIDRNSMSINIVHMEKENGGVSWRFGLKNNFWGELPTGTITQLVRAISGGLGLKS